MKINWDVVKAVGGQLLVTGGAVSTALIAFGYSQQQVDGILALLASVLSLACMVGPSLIVVFQQTDKGKAGVIEKLDESGRTAVVSNLTPQGQSSLASTIQATMEKKP